MDTNLKICIIGSARHGKDTCAEFMKELFGFTFQSSSEAAAEIFIYNKLRGTYGYKTPFECFEDRVNHRKLWHDLICDYNKDDKTRLAQDIMSGVDIYVGMRSDAEINACKEIELFDFIIGVYNPNLPEEPKESFDINIWEQSDFVIPNAGTKEQFKNKIYKLQKLFTPVTIDYEI